MCVNICICIYLTIYIYILHTERYRNSTSKGATGWAGWNKSKRLRYGALNVMLVMHLFQNMNCKTFIYLFIICICKRKKAASCGTWELNFYFTKSFVCLTVLGYLSWLSRLQIPHFLCFERYNFPIMFIYHYCGQINIITTFLYFQWTI